MHKIYIAYTFFSYIYRVG